MAIDSEGRKFVIITVLLTLCFPAWLPHFLSQRSELLGLVAVSSFRHYDCFQEKQGISHGRLCWHQLSEICTACGGGVVCRATLKRNTIRDFQAFKLFRFGCFESTEFDGCNSASKYKTVLHEFPLAADSPPH